MISRIAVVLFAWAVLTAPAAAQFWAPFSYRGYQSPRGGVFDTLRPYGSPTPAKPDQSKKGATPDAAAQPAAPPAPYEAEFARLAELLGALNYLRPLCGEKEIDRWKNEMQELLDAEQPPQERKDRLVASFNRGYQSYQLTYRNCTPSANLAISRSLDESAKLARDIAARYGN